MTMQESTLDQFRTRKKDSSHTAYPDYKQVDYNKFGEIPQPWNILKLKQVSEISPSNVDKKEKDGEPSIRLCNYTDVYNNSQITSDIDFMEATAKKSDILKFRLEEGDVIITKDSESWDDIGVPSFVAETMEDVICGYHLAHLKPYDSEIDGKYLYYFLGSTVGSHHFHTEANGVTRFGISVKRIKEAPVIVPPKNEQKSISKFLDRETNRIDELIKKKKELVSLLREREEALITQVTTRGLSGEVSTREATDEIVGELPEDWKESKLGNITTKLTNGYVGPTRDILREDGVPYIQSTHINNGEIEFKGEFFVSEEWSNNHQTSKLKPGDVLLIQTGDIGESAVVRKDLEGANCHALIIARPVDDVNSLYLNLFLESKLGKNLLKRTQTGATLKHLNTTRVKDVTVPVPPKDEQEKIVEFLESEREYFDSLVNQIEKGIEQLQEYRAALITETVTGQIDIRGEV